MKPLQASTFDCPGAEQMMFSALTLGKAQNDLSTLVSASRGLLQMQLGAGSGAAAGGAPAVVMTPALCLYRGWGNLRVAPARGGTRQVECFCAET